MPCMYVCASGWRSTRTRKQFFSNWHMFMMYVYMYVMRTPYVCTYKGALNVSGLKYFQLFE